MSEQIYSSAHPDAEVLNAFAEGALGEQERAACAAHLAECARCREIVFLAAGPVEAVEKKRGRIPFRLVGGALAAGLAIVAVVVHERPKPMQPMAEPVLQKEIAKPQPALAPATALAPTAAQPASRIEGRVSDATGAGVAGAKVTARAMAHDKRQTVKTDAGGKYAMPPVSAGQYELKVESPGFAQAKKQVEVKKNETAEADATLKAGVVTESVEVTAAAPMVQAAPTAEAMKTDRISTLARDERTVEIGKNRLTLDANGNLLLSKKGGRFKPVKAKWQGKATQLEKAREMFQVSTDSGETWMSEDGAHWTLQEK